MQPQPSRVGGEVVELFGRGGGVHLPELGVKLRDLLFGESRVFGDGCGVLLEVGVFFHKSAYLAYGCGDCVEGGACGDGEALPLCAPVGKSLGGCCALLAYFLQFAVYPLQRLGVFVPLRASSLYALRVEQGGKLFAYAAQAFLVFARKVAERFAPGLGREGELLHFAARAFHRLLCLAQSLVVALGLEFLAELLELLELALELLEPFLRVGELYVYREGNVVGGVGHNARVVTL